MGIVTVILSDASARKQAQIDEKRIREAKACEELELKQAKLLRECL